MKSMIHEYQNKNILTMSKKIFLTLAIIFGGLVSAQDYYDTYPQDYNGYEYYDSSYDYPDDYYYNYPADYYPDQYYQGYYNDYRNAVFSVNWDQFFVQYRLSPFQINQIMLLNNRFASYAAWNSYYRYNPDRWYYDRFYALQNILGPRIFVVYQNVYFRGASPFVYYRNRGVNFYARRYPVRPVYRNVNIVNYRVDRNNFRANFREPMKNNNINPRAYNNDGVRNGLPRSGANGNSGIRPNGNSGVRSGNDGGFRNNRVEADRTMPSSAPRSEGFRNQSGTRQNQSVERSSQNRNNNNSGNSGGYRSSGNRLVSR